MVIFSHSTCPMMMMMILPSHDEDKYGFDFSPIPCFHTHKF